MSSMSSNQDPLSALESEGISLCTEIRPLFEEFFDSLQILEPWHRVNTNHLELQQVVQMIQRTSSVYFEAIDASVKASQDGYSVIHDAVELCDYLLNPVTDPGYVQGYIRSIQSRMKLTRDESKITLQKFGDVVNGWVEIRNTIQKHLIAPKPGGPGYPNPGGYSSWAADNVWSFMNPTSHQIDFVTEVRDRNLPVLDAEKLLGHTNKFWNWWNTMDRVLGYCDLTAHNLRFLRDIKRVNQTKDRWMRIRNDYYQYSAQISELRNHYYTLQGHGYGQFETQPVWPQGSFGIKVPGYGWPNAQPQIHYPSQDQHYGWVNPQNLGSHNHHMPQGHTYGWNENVRTRSHFVPQSPEYGGFNEQPHEPYIPQSQQPERYENTRIQKKNMPEIQAHVRHNAKAVEARDILTTPNAVTEKSNLSSVQVDALPKPKDLPVVIAPPTAPDALARLDVSTPHKVLDLIVESSQKSMWIINSWRRASSNHPSLSNAIQEVCALGLIYYDAIDMSIKTAQDGYSFSTDVIQLCDYLLDKTTSMEDLREYIQDMKDKAKQAYGECTETLNKFREVRRGLNDITKKLPEEVADNEKGKVSVRIPGSVHQAESKREAVLIDAVKELNLAVVDLGAIYNSVDGFAAWWNGMETVLKNAERGGSELRPGKDTLRVKHVRNTWVSIQGDYKQYKFKIIQLQDHYPSERREITIMADKRL